MEKSSTSLHTNVLVTEGLGCDEIKYAAFSKFSHLRLSEVTPFTSIFAVSNTHSVLSPVFLCSGGKLNFPGHASHRSGVVILCVFLFVCLNHVNKYNTALQMRCIMLLVFGVRAGPGIISFKSGVGLIDGV